MPTYSYRCRECGVEFDIHQEFSDQALTNCPRCQGALRKLFSAVGVTFQGSGFYRTDSRVDSGKSKAAGSKESSTPAAAPEKAASAPSSSSSSPSTTASPASAPAAK